MNGERYPNLHPDDKKLIEDIKELNKAIKKFLQEVKENESV